MAKVQKKQTKPKVEKKTTSQVLNRKATKAKTSSLAKKKTPASSKAKPKTKVLMETKKVIAELVDDTSDSQSENYDFDQNSDENVLSKIENEKANTAKDFDIIDSDEPVLLESKSKALTTSDPIAMYLAEIRRYPLLSREQELELAKKYYETKDPQAAQALVTANLRFVVKVAAEYSRFGARMIDLVQEGNMGLMHAVREFNPYKGVRLITYAVWWIRGYIQEYMMKQFSLVKIGTTQNQKKLFYQLQKQKEELEAMGQGADIKLLSSKLGIPEDEVKMMAQRMSGRDISLDRPLDEDSGHSLMDLQSGESESPDDRISRKEELSYLLDAIEELRPQLSERELIILNERLLNDEPLTLQEIGEKHGITREAVRQMEVRVMKKIKDHFATKSKSDLGD